MAAGDSKVSICNIGLIQLGEPPIASLDDPRKAAIYCKARYDQVRREILRSHPWNCARKQALVPASLTPPLFDWSAAYPLPADFLRVYRLNRDENASYEVQAGELLCNIAGALQLVYIRDEEDPTKFDPILTAAIGYGVGAAVAQALTQSQVKEDRCNGLVEGKLATARFVGAQESTPEEWDTDVLLQSRF